MALRFEGRGFLSYVFSKRRDSLNQAGDRLLREDGDQTAKRSSYRRSCGFCQTALHNVPLASLA
jgi:hypothetical protein